VSEDGIHWTAHETEFETVNQIHFANHHFVALAEDQIGISSDGETWEYRPAPDTHSTRGLVYNDGVYVLRSGGHLYRSEDLTTWEQVFTFSSSRTLDRGLYFNGAFLMYSTSGYNYTVASPDGFEWQFVLQPAGSSYDLRTILKFKDYLVADTVEHTSISFDGRTWIRSQLLETRSEISYVAGETVFRLSESDGLFKSEDGLIWRHETNNISPSFNRVAQNEDTVVAVGGQIFSGSPSERFRKVYPDNLNQNSDPYIDVAYGHLGFIALYVSDDFGVLEVSENGKDWQLLSFSDMTGLHQILAGNGIYMLFDSAQGVLTSSNGINWENVHPALGGQVKDGIFALDKHIAFTSDSVYVSEDNGVSWESSFIGAEIQDIAYGNGLLVGVNNTDIYFSEDGRNWNIANFPFGNMTAITFDGKKFIGSAHGKSALGEGRIYASEDAQNWRILSYSGPYHALDMLAVGEDMVVTAALNRSDLSLHAANDSDFCQVSATLAATTVQVCANGSAQLPVQLTGEGPWTIVWSDGVTERGITDPNHARSQNVEPGQSYQVMEVHDLYCKADGDASTTNVVLITPEEFTQYFAAWQPGGMLDLIRDLPHCPGNE
jgi:hypothetical protein